MAKVIDMAGVARGDALLDNAIKNNPAVLDRLTTEDITEMVADTDTILSVRVPKTLADRLARLARLEAVRRDERVTRNSIIVELLETALADRERRDQE
jgi:hypothetical protein